MDIKTLISPDETEQVLIKVKEERNEIRQLESHIKSFFWQRLLSVKAGGESYRIQQSEIIRVYREARKLQLVTTLGQFERNSSIAQVKRELGQDFIQISQSEIINKKYVRQLRVTGTGLIEIGFSSGDRTYASRRYAKVLKEAF